MAVPAHDERDYAFAVKYNIPIRPVVVPKAVRSKEWRVFTEYGVLVNSGSYTGKTSEEAQKLMAEYLEEHNLGKNL